MCDLIVRFIQGLLTSLGDIYLVIAGQCLLKACSILVSIPSRPRSTSTSYIINIGRWSAISTVKIPEIKSTKFVVKILFS